MHHILSVALVSLALIVSSVPTTPRSFAISPAVARSENPTFRADHVAQVNEFLDRLAAIGFRGSALVASDDEVLLERGYGRVDPSGEEEIAPDTLFAIGSNTKPFTAAAILKLQDDGKLGVDDRIGRYLPDVPMDKQEITIHQLLTHSAGFNHSGIFEGDFEQVDRDKAVRRILASELLFPPGSESSYADASMILLAAIVEIASGRPYEAYLREELFAPAGMEHTGFRSDDPKLLGSVQAVGVVEGEPAGSPADLPPLSWSIKGAGGMVSTVDDLFRWHQAVQAGEILSLERRRAYAATHVPLDETRAEGYGWVIAELAPGHRLRAHAGGTEEIGHVNVIQWWMDDGLVVIVSSADAAYSAEDVATAIDKIVFGLPQEMPPAIVDVDPEALHKFAGRYEIPEGGAIIVSALEDRLLFSPEDAAGFATLYPPDAAGEGQQPDPVATIDYLESGQEASLDAWKADLETTLGPYQQMVVMGTASPEGSGESWTYVVFEFTSGSALTRWIVDDGVLSAAVVPSEPPTMMFMPTSPATFASFSLGRPTGFDAVFADGPGASTLRLTTSDGEQIVATRPGS